MYPMYDYNYGLSPYGYGFGISPFTVTTPITPPAHPEVAPYVSTHEEKGVNASALLLTSAAVGSIAALLLLARHGRAKKIIEGAQTTVQDYIAKGKAEGEKLIEDADKIARQKVTDAHDEAAMVKQRAEDEAKQRIAAGNSHYDQKVDEGNKHFDKRVAEATEKANQITEAAQKLQQKAEEFQRQVLEALTGKKKGATSTNATTIRRGAGKNATEQLDTVDIEPLTSSGEKTTGKKTLKPGTIAPESVEAFEKGKIAHKVSDYSKAIEEYGKAITHDPKNLGAYINKSGCHVDLGNQVKRLGNEAEADRHYKEAFKTLQEAATQFPEDITIWEKLSECHKLGIGTAQNLEEEAKCLKQIEGILEPLDKGILKGLSTEARVKFSDILNRLGLISTSINPKEAFSYFTRAAKKNPQNSEALLNLANCYRYGIGDIAVNPTEEIKYLKKVVALGGKNEAASARLQELLGGSKPPTGAPPKTGSKATTSPNPLFSLRPSKVKILDGKDTLGLAPTAPGTNHGGASTDKKTMAAKPSAKNTTGTGSTPAKPASTSAKTSLKATSSKGAPAKPPVSTSAKTGIKTPTGSKATLAKPSTTASKPSLSGKILAEPDAAKKAKDEIHEAPTRQVENPENAGATHVKGQSIMGAMTLMRKKKP